MKNIINRPLNIVEETYYNLTYTLNNTDSIEEVFENVALTLETMLNNPDLEVAEFIIHNTLLIASFIIKKYKERYKYYNEFQLLESCYNALTSEKNAQKR